MMKVATVTWITYNNYGTQLQAYALQQYLLSLGIDNTIISDEKIIEEIAERNSITNSIGSMYVDCDNDTKCTTDLTSNARSSFNIVTVLHKIKKRIIKKLKPTNRKNRRINLIRNATRKKYIEFKNRHLIIEWNYSRQDMNKLNDSYDAFVCGSDQIWSLLDRNIDPFFFLNFSKKKKISYAPSIGLNNIPTERESFLKSILENFNSISVREKTTAEQLTKILSKDVSWVVDPTLLYDNSFWREKTTSIKVKGKRYILCYFLENRDWYFDYCIQLAKFLDLDILLLPSREEYYNNTFVYKGAVGPFEFVKLYENADFILTDSYHGSLFALNYSKQFLYLKRFKDNDTECQNVRIYSILNYLNLNCLIIDEKVFNKSDIINIDYSQVAMLLEKARNESREFLFRSLYGKEDLR